VTLDPYRLPLTVLPRHYAITLEPELGHATFAGSVRIDIDITAGVEQIVLNAIELDVLSVLVNSQPADFVLDEDTERLTISSQLSSGNATIDIEFTGILNDKLRGFYRSTYTDDNGAQQVIACSQMQSTDCRRVFPCFDEPEFKATFGITLVVDPTMMAISNGPEVSRATTANGRSAVTFDNTFPMSTYLVAVIVGQLEATETVDVAGTPLRVVHVPGKAHLTELALDVGAVALEWFQDYYGIAYPGKKVDMVALPDFAAGAMENLGCITYRESLLLLDPQTSTQNEQQLVADVVSHELAHMWFGDLVTMRWWNGIWLNEAFATFMEVMAVEVFRPDWKRWTNFSLERSDAFEVDSLASTRTVEFEVRAPSDCDGMFDVLTYQKGGALLRMLQQYLGEERFRQGVNQYLRTHSYGSTETGDLWDSIEQVTTADGGNEPVRQLMDSWIWQAGFPLVSVSLDGNDLVLRQQRFSFSPESTDPTLFITPVAVRVGETTHMVLLDGAEARLALHDATAPIVVNAGGHGFFRVSYADNLRSRIGSDTLASLNTVERYNLVDDASASLVAGRLTAAGLLEFLEGFTAERELAVWQAIAASVRRLHRLIEGTALAPFEARVRQMVASAIDDLSWTPATNEDDLRSKLRGLLVTMLAVYGADADARQRCRVLLASDHASVDPELLAASTVVVASIGDADDFDNFVTGFRSATTPQEQLRNLYALAEFDSAELVERACNFALSSEVRSQNAPYVLARCIANRWHGELAWTIVRKHWDYANATFPNPSIIRMVDPVKTLNNPSVIADVQSFFAEHPIPQSVNTLAQVLERQRVNGAVHERESATFAATLLS